MQRLRLDKVTEADSAALFSLWSDLETVRFTNWTLLTRQEECDQRVESMLRRYDPSSARVGPFLVRSADGEFLGLIGLDMPEPFDGAHELWYLIRRDRWNLGHGGAAIAQVLGQLMEYPQVKRIVATAVVANVASWRLLERHGFTRIGVADGGVDQRGLKVDVYEYVREVP